MAADWLTEVHDAGRQIRGVSYRLEDLGVAFGQIGLLDVAEELQQSARVLIDSEKQITGAISEMLHKEVQASMATSALVFNAAIASTIREGEAFSSGVKAGKERKNVE